MGQPPLTLIKQIQQWVESKPQTPAIHDKYTGSWRTYTWEQYWLAIRETAKGLIALGHEVGDCVAIVGDNRTEWVICQFGMMAARGIPAPIYGTNTVDQTMYIVDHCRAKIAICDTQHQLDKYLEGLDAAGDDARIEHIITMDEISSADDRVMSLSALRELGREQDDDALDARLDELTDTETALLIYTSGTTGVPKAVQLSHRNMCVMANGILAYFSIFEREPYRLVSYLPLSHVAEQMFTNMLSLRTGGEIYFCSNIKQVKEYLLEVRPTIFLGVPRVWEKFQAALEAKLAEATGFKAKMAAWALRTELDSFKREVASGHKVSSFGRWLANRLVISKIKERLGLDQLIAAATGSAPIALETLEFFASIGIVLYEGYGMSETTGVATTSTFGSPRFGSVGKALPGVEVKIAEDGEILMRGDIMTKGYLHMPEKTAELLDDDNWLYTGDIGELDKDGYLRITGRKKDLLITAGGKNVAPVAIEDALKAIPGIGQAVVVGDRKPYLCALLTLDSEYRAELASQLGLSDDSEATMIADEKVRSYIEAQIESQCNAGLARYQTIKKFEILDHEFTVESGELTPTMKLKRNVIHERYADDIEQFYQS